MTVTAGDYPTVTERAWSNNWRIGKILHLDVMVVSDATDSDLLEAIEWGDVDPDVLGERIEGDVDVRAAGKGEELAEFLSWRQPTGWLVQIETPADRRRRETGYSYSWGITMSRWFGGDTYDEALAAAVAWVESDPDELYFTPPSNHGLGRAADINAPDG